MKLLVLLTLLSVALLPGAAMVVPTATATWLEDPRSISQSVATQEQPSPNDSDQATANWKGVLVPLIVVLAVIFAAGLFLMRIWHWIDPT